jgi:hypothetical protein
MTRLPYKVECRSSYPFFEIIAAFDCDLAATNYASDCAVGHPSFEYRVIDSHKRIVWPKQPVIRRGAKIRRLV